MCPICMTNAALVVAGATSGAGVVGFVAVKVRACGGIVASHAAQRFKNNKQ